MLIIFLLKYFTVFPRQQPVPKNVYVVHVLFKILKNDYSTNFSL